VDRPADVEAAFAPYQLAGRTLANRIVLAPMTRNRAYGPGNSPTPLMATYYAQRASAGLLVTEGTHPDPVGQAYLNVPGLHSDEQVEAWRVVTDAVHERGGIIFAQLMHSGRISHPSLLPAGAVPVGPSAVPAQGTVMTADGPRDFVTPHELTGAEIRETIAGYAAAARNAIAAGFDGVELHGANGYLIHQFLSDNANLRTDEWGGSDQGRIRFAVEVATAVAEAIGADRLGFRISPGNPYNDIVEAEPADRYLALAEQLASLSPAYLHLIENADRDFTWALRKRWPSTLILNPHTGPEPTGPSSLSLIADGLADLVSFGTLFLANPDLPERLRRGGPFNAPDRDTFYGGDGRGYTDYPTLGEAG
jgi:N-ethylmaleimide reductase